MGLLMKDSGFNSRAMYPFDSVGNEQKIKKFNIFSM